MPDWESSVTDLGARSYGWLDGNLLLVSMDNEAKALVENLNIVEWVDLYHPAYKIPYGLIENGEP